MQLLASRGIVTLLSSGVTTVGPVKPFITAGLRFIVACQDVVLFSKSLSVYQCGVIRTVNVASMHMSYMHQESLGQCGKVMFASLGAHRLVHCSPVHL